jgi:hypothetical protein
MQYLETLESSRKFLPYELQAALERLEKNQSDATKDVDRYVTATLATVPAVFGAVKGISALDTDGGGFGGGISKGGDGKKGTLVSGETWLPGLSRPVRPANPSFPPDAAVVKAMASPQIQKMTKCTSTVDCSEIASHLLAAAGGKGKILEVRPAKAGNLNIYENGKSEYELFYHQIYTDGRYVYDPRLSGYPVPKGDWERHMRGINPDGVTISDKLKGLP